MKSPPDQNLNPPQPDGYDDFIHMRADAIAQDPVRMVKEIDQCYVNNTPENLGNLIIALAESHKHIHHTQEYNNCIERASNAWHNIAYEAAKREMKNAVK